MLIIGALLALPMGLLLGLLGGGGSILTVPILVYVLGLDAKIAIATSLFIVGTTSVISTLQHARAGNVQYKTGLVFGVFAMGGAYAGGFSAGFVSGQLLILLFAVLMVITSIAMLRPRTIDSNIKREFSPAKIALEGMIVGGITGMVGAGGGFVVVPALVLFGGLEVRTAIGTSLLIIALKSFAALAGHLGHISIDIWLALAITGPAILGSLVGTRLSNKIPPAALRQGFAYFVLAMAALMLYKEAPVEFLYQIFVPYWPLWLTGAAVATLAVATLVLWPRRLVRASRNERHSGGNEHRTGGNEHHSGAHLKHALDRP